MSSSAMETGLHSQMVLRWCAGFASPPSNHMFCIFSRHSLLILFPFLTSQGKELLHLVHKFGLCWPPTTGSEFGCLSVPMPEKGGSMLELLCMWRVKYLYLNISPCQSNCCVIVITFQTSNHLNQAPRSIYQSMMILYYSLFQIPLPESPFAPLLCAIDRRVPWVPACCTWKFPFRQRHNQLDVILAHRVAAEISKTRVWPLRLSVMNRITTWWLEQSWSKKLCEMFSFAHLLCIFNHLCPPLS